MKNPVNRVGIIFGIILAVYYILFNTIIFFTDLSLFSNPFAGFTSMGVVIILGVLTVFLARRKAGGYVTFREGFTPYLLMITIGVTVNYIVYNILFHLVDPSAQEVVNKDLYDMLIQTLNNSGLPQEQIDSQLQKAAETTQFAGKSQIFLWAGSILRNSVLGLLLAAIFKNKSEFIPMQPTHDLEEEMQEEQIKTTK